MKTLTLVIPFLCLPVLAVASIPLGRGEVTLGFAASSNYDSNLSGSQNGPGDGYGTLTPHADYARNAGKIVATASLGVTAVRYLDETQFDTENLNVNGTLKLSEDVGQKITFSLTGGYNESFDVNSDLNTRLRSKTAAFTGQGSLITGPRTRLSVNASFSDAINSGASDQQQYSAGGNFDYTGFLNDTTFGVNYNYSETHSSGQNVLGAELDQSSHQFGASLSRPLYHEINGRFGVGYRMLARSRAETATGDSGDSSPVYTVGIDGPFLPRRLFPKIKSTFSLSYEKATAPGINDPGSNTLAGSLSFNWQARANTNVSFSANRSQRLTASDLTAVSSVITAGLTQQIGGRVSGGVNGSYSWEDFRGVVRKDHRISLSGNLAYTFARSWNTGLSYRYDIIDSSIRTAEYTRHVVVLSLSHQF